MSGARSRNKGARFENKIANDLTELTGLQFGRSLIQTRGGGVEAGDICLKDTESHPAVEQLHFELKHHQKASINDAWKQALSDCEGTQRVPVIITKSDREEPKATVPNWFLAELAASWVADKPQGDKPVTIPYQVFKEMFLPWTKSNS